MLAPLRGCLVLAVCLFVAGCPQGIDNRADFDSLINDVWLVDFETEDAIAYLERGGTHFDFQRESTSVDEEVVLPLLKRLRDEFSATSTAALGEEMNWAWVILVAVSPDPISRSQVATAVEEADVAFDGVIQMEWGYQWLALNFLTEEEAELERQDREEYGAWE